MRFSSVPKKDSDGGSTTANSRLSAASLGNNSGVYKDVEVERSRSQKKFIKKIRTRISKQTEEDDQAVGLLGIDTMMSAI